MTQRLSVKKKILIHLGEMLKSSGELAKEETEKLVSDIAGVSVDEVDCRPDLKVATKLALLGEKYKAMSVDEKMKSFVWMSPEQYHAVESKYRGLSELSADSLSALWQRIISETDEIYVVTEVITPALFEAAVRCFLDQQGINADIKMRNTAKDPVRAFEKAYDDYIDRFTDPVPPTACVFDMIGCRLLCKDAKGMIGLMTGLAADVLEVNLPDGSKATLELIRVKNKLCPDELDPVSMMEITSHDLSHANCFRADTLPKCGLQRAHESW